MKLSQERAAAIAESAADKVRGLVLAWALTTDLSPDDLLTVKYVCSFLPNESGDLVVNLSVPEPDQVINT